MAVAKRRDRIDRAGIGRRWAPWVLLGVLFVAAGGATAFGVAGAPSATRHASTAAGSPTGRGTPHRATRLSPPTGSSPTTTAPAQLVQPSDPGEFGPAAASFINANQGWVLRWTGCDTCGGLIETTDGGTAWTSLPPLSMPLGFAVSAPNAITDLYFNDQENGYLFGPSLFLTHDGGSTWQQTSLPVTQVTGLTATDGFAYALAESGSDPDEVSSLWRNAIGTGTWTQVPLPPGAQVPQQPPMGPLDLYAESGTLLLLQIGLAGPDEPTDLLGQLWSSANQGGTWTAHAVPCTEPDGGASIASMALGHPDAWLVDCFNNEQSQEDQRTQHHLYGSANAGRTWVRLGDPSDRGAPVSLADNGSGHAVLTVQSGGGGFLMATNDGGVDWALRLTIGGDEYGWGDLSFVTPSTGFVVGPTHYAPEDLYRTDDGGATWKIVPIDGSACTSAQLGVSAGTKGVGLGHVGIPLVFRNVSDQACTLSGYPGVAGLDVHGSQTIQATRTPKGYLGGLTFSSGGPVPAVDLQPGATASALVEGTDTTEPACPIYPSLLVTAPNTFQSVSLDIEMPGCTGLQVHPVVPGSSGSEAQ